MTQDADQERTIENRCRDELAVALANGASELTAHDPELASAIATEHTRQPNTLMMVAASSLAPPAVAAVQGSAFINTTTEGYPGARYHGGSSVADVVERLAVDRAKSAFGASYANVQPHSGSSANLAVMFELLNPQDILLGFDLHAGGHLTHGSTASISGRYFRSVAYGVDRDGYLNYDEVASIASATRPRMIVAGASAYPRSIDFEKFRRIADDVGAFLLADISHIAGLVVAGRHMSPIDHAHVTTTSTYKQLGGPRGGLILLGRDALTITANGRVLAERMDHAVFPLTQGTPDLGAVAAKAAALKYVAEPAFAASMGLVVSNASALAEALTFKGFDVQTGGTDNHMVLIDLRGRGVTGVIVEQALERCGVIVNRNKIVGDPRSARITSGLRLGTNSMSMRGMAAAEMKEAASLVAEVVTAIRPITDTEFTISDDVIVRTAGAVAELCRAFPLPGYVRE